MHYFRFVNWLISGFVFWRHEQVVWPCCAALFPHTSLYTMYIVHYFASTKMVPKNKTKTNLLFVLVVLLQIVGISIIFKKNTNKKRHFHSKSAGDFFSPHNFWSQGNSRSPWNTKGQLISKCLFGVKTSSKKPTNFFPGFLPNPLKRVQIKKVL